MFRYLIVAVVLCAAGIAAVFLPRDVTVADVRTCIANTHVDVACAGELVGKLLAKEDAAALMREFETQMPAQCHFLGHIVGKYVYADTGSMEGAYAACSSAECASACLHGAAIAALISAPGIRTALEGVEHPLWEDVGPEAATLCKERQACHAVGHVLMSLSDDVNNALAKCDDVAPDSDSLQACFRGVFMEIGNATLARIESVPSGKQITDPDNLLSPCSAMEKRYQRACFQFLFINQTASPREVGTLTPEMTRHARIDACREATNSVRTPCAEGLGYSLYSLDSVERSFDACNRFAANEHAACVLGVSRGYIDFGEVPERVAEQCAGLGTVAAKKSCYLGVFDAVAQRYKDPQNVCDAATDSLCVEQYAAYRMNPVFPTID